MILPALFGYFFNLSTRTVKRGGYKQSIARYPVDPLTFNVVKMLLTYLAYELKIVPFFSEKSRESVEFAMYGGTTGMNIGSAIGILAAMYEAAQVS